MERHGSETYWVEGEGVLGESGGGRPEDARVAMAVTAPPFRFSRVGPKGSQLGDLNRRKLAAAMTRGTSRDGSVPAGFTYLGQFIDHDLTFDVTRGLTLGEQASPTELLQGRSPSLDLDSLYGAGPNGAASSRFYRADGIHLRTGATEGLGAGAGSAGPDRAGFDLPREGAGDTVRARRRPLIPDRRNDENLAVAQTHALFIRFHNRVVDELASDGVPEANRFTLARRRVVKHYQWMIRHDLLPRIVAPAIVDDVFTNGRRLVEPGADPMSVPTMPIEFSIAAYRLGHSMIRGAYNWNAFFDGGAGTLFLLFAFSGTSGDLAGGIDNSDPDAGAARLPSNWIADFRRLFDFGEAGRADLTVPAARFNRAKRIDTTLVNPLRNLPPGSFGGPAVPRDDPRANLAFRNLTRAHMVRMATGQDMAALLQSRGVGVTPLTRAQILEGAGGAELDALTANQRDTVARNTPLWFYVLREAEVADGRMRGVGGRIVAETFHRAMEGSRHSIVRDRGFRPVLGPDADTFRMVDLLLFTAKGRGKGVKPPGDD
jgi:hypothetical protein